MSAHKKIPNISFPIPNKNPNTSNTRPLPPTTLHMKRRGRGLSRLDRTHFQNTQADLDDMVVNIVITMITANFITKAKTAIASAFAPSFAFARA